jgi:hypothetical protein
MADDTDRYDDIVDQLTMSECADLARAIDDWRAVRDIHDDLDPFREALRRRARHEVDELEDAGGGGN